MSIDNAQPNVEARTPAELCRVLHAMDIQVPLPSEGRTNEQREKWIFCRLLSSLATTAHIKFPMKVWKRERPDYHVLLGADHIGLEITSATHPNYSQMISSLSNERDDGSVIDMSLFSWKNKSMQIEQLEEIKDLKELTGDGWCGHQVEEEWTEAMYDIIGDKTKKLVNGYAPFEENWLCIYANLPIPGINVDTGSKYLELKLRGYWATEKHFDAIFIEEDKTLIRITTAGTDQIKITDFLLTSVGQSDPGRVRQNNEDFIHSDDSLGIYFLADGMGGHNAGEVASELAVKTAQAYITERLSSAKDDDISDILFEAMKAAHEAVNAKAKTDLGLMNMGTTLVEVVIRNNKAFICHAGDSRAYLHHDTLQRFTRDHTMGDHLLENNILPRERIPEKQWHILTQAVGVGDPPVPDIKQIELASGDMLLLCSDGLTDMLTDTEIEAIIAGGNLNLNIITQGLIDAANNKGGHDNISVVLVKI